MISFFGTTQHSYLPRIKTNEAWGRILSVPNILSYFIIIIIIIIIIICLFI
jgi:hypothetical protein